MSDIRDEVEGRMKRNCLSMLGPDVIALVFCCRVSFMCGGTAPKIANPMRESWSSIEAVEWDAHRPQGAGIEFCDSKPGSRRRAGPTIGTRDIQCNSGNGQGLRIILGFQSGVHKRGSASSRPSTVMPHC